MEFEKTGDISHPYKLTFNEHETETVRAAYREHMYYLALKGNAGSMSEYEAHISGWEEDGQPKSIRPLSPSSVAEVLDDFSERTEEVIATIPETTGIAAFQSDDIGERLRLGRLAAGLATELKEIEIKQEMDPSIIPDELSSDSIHRWIEGEDK